MCASDKQTVESKVASYVMQHYEAWSVSYQYLKDCNGCCTIPRDDMAVSCTVLAHEFTYSQISVSAISVANVVVAESDSNGISIVKLERLIKA